MANVPEGVKQAMEEIFPGPTSYLDDVSAMATTGGSRFANILSAANKEYEREVKAEMERFQLSREKPKPSQSGKNSMKAADCVELEDAYNLLFKDGEKPVPMKDYTEIKEKSTGARKKTLDDAEKQFNQLQELANLNLKIQKAGKENVPRRVMTKSMLEAASILKQIASEGSLYAIHKYNGGLRSAKITYSKDKLLLHRLRKKHPPSSARVVYHNDVMKLVDPSSRLTFLHLGEEELSNFGKVFIRLRGNTLAAKQFSSLCTGEMGHTYAGFTCVELFNENHKTLEYVRMGDYEKCNGTGGKPLFPGLDVNNGDYVRPWVAGTVEGCWIWKKEIGAQFDILMKDNPGRMCEAAFGLVEEGFRVLRAAIYESVCVEMLCVHDCGIVLSQS